MKEKHTNQGETVAAAIRVTDAGKIAIETTTQIDENQKIIAAMLAECGVESEPLPTPSTMGCGLGSSGAEGSFAIKHRSTIRKRVEEIIERH